VNDLSGIPEEIEAERREIKKLISQAKKFEREYVVLGNSPFFSLEEGKGKLIITGVALAEGVWKNVLYPAEEIAKAAKKLKNKPLKVEHGQDEEFKDKAVGKVLDAYYDPTLKSLIFKAEVTDPKAIEKIKSGEFPAVSCSTWVDKFPINSQQSVGFNFLFNELSLVRNPGCEKCFIFSVEELSKKLKGLNIKREEEEVGEREMEKELVESAQGEEVIEELETEEEVDLTEIEPPKLYAVVEYENLSDLLEELGVKKIVTYYYGYPYPYPGYYGKYPYPGYPYYPYYPYYPAPEGEKPKKEVKRAKEKKFLWAVVELESPEEIEELKRTKKVVAVYYGYYGYPYPYRYPHYGYYPYYPYYPYYGKYPAPKSAENELREKKEEVMSGEELIDMLDLAEDYKTFMKKCMKEKTDIKDVVERMKACAEEWKKLQEKSEENAEKKECPEGQVWDEEQGKCVPVQEKYPAPEEKTEEVKDLAEQGKELSEKTELSEEAKEVQEEKKTPCGEEAPCGEKKEETKEEAEEAKKVETEEEKEKAEEEKKEGKKEEAVQEVEKEVKIEVTETKEEEKTQPKEEKKLSAEELEKYVREHYPEIILELIKKRQF